MRLMSRMCASATKVFGEPRGYSANGQKHCRARGKLTEKPRNDEIQQLRCDYFLTSLRQCHPLLSSQHQQ